LSIKKQVFLSACICVFALASFYTAVALAARIQGVFFPGTKLHIGGIVGNLPGLEAPADSVSSDPITFLVLGLDSRPVDGSFGNTDTQFIVRVDPVSKTARSLAIPRDLYIDIPTSDGKGTVKDRINAVYNYGESRKPGGGPLLIMKVLGQVLGLQIDHYVIINFDGFKNVVDSVGGIDVDVAEAINDPYYSDTEKPGDFYPCVFTKGQHHMNGTQALCYSRTRYNNSDLDRILRQQRVSFATIQKARQQADLSRPASLIGFWKQYQSLIRTDVNDLQIPGLARMAEEVDIDSFVFLSLGPALSDYVTPGGAAVLLGSPDGIKQVVYEFVSAP